MSAHSTATGEPAAEPLLEARNLQVHYPIRKGILRRTVGHVKAVDGIDLSLSAGRTLGVVGESGCGKTTLGQALLRLISSTGSIRFEGQAIDTLGWSELRPLRSKMQFVFQDPYGALSPRLSVFGIVAEGLLLNRMVSTADEARERVAIALGEVGLPADVMDRYPHEFSGGQRQRISIARALALTPSVLVLDEPTSALDLSVQAQIVNLLNALQARHRLAYLFISHDLRVVRAMADDLLVMRSGLAVERGHGRSGVPPPRHRLHETAAASRAAGAVGGECRMTRAIPVAYFSVDDPVGPWRDLCRALDLPVQLREWPAEIEDPAAIEAAFVWHAPPAMWADLPNLRFVQTIGTGVDHLLAHPPPASVTLARTVDPTLTEQMVEYAVLAVLACHRSLHHHLRNQGQGVWGTPPVRRHRRHAGRRHGNRRDRRGHPSSGSGHSSFRCAPGRAPDGRASTAWTGSGGRTSSRHSWPAPAFSCPCCRRPPPRMGCSTASGCVSYRAAPTSSISGAAAPSSSGTLTRAWHSGHLASCFLDVFAEEPLSPASPFWQHPQVIVTPHAAGVNFATPYAARLLADNLERVLAGQPPQHGISSARGY